MVGIPFGVVVRLMDEGKMQLVFHTRVYPVPDKVNGRED